MADTSLNSISLTLRLSRALALARRGKLREAQELIMRDRTIPEDPVALHALAALVTTEGDYLRARKLWELLLQRDPKHAEARRMVEAIDVWINRPTWAKYVPYAAGIAVLGALVAVAMSLLSTPDTVEKKSGNVPPGTNAPIETSTLNPVNAPAAAPRYVAPTPLPAIQFPTTTPPRRHSR